MKYRKLTDSGDYNFGRGEADFISDIDAVGQAIKTRLLLLYGEWWEDTEDGLPLWEQIIGVPCTPANKGAVDIIIRDRISGTTGVESVLNFDSTFENRKYNFSCLVQTIYGTLAVSM